MKLVILAILALAASAEAPPLPAIPDAQKIALQRDMIEMLNLQLQLERALQKYQTHLAEARQICAQGGAELAGANGDVSCIAKGK